MSARDDALALLERVVREDGQQLARYAWGVLRNQGHATDEVDVLQDIVGEAVLTATQIIRSNDGRIPDSANGVRVWLRKIVAYKAMERRRTLARDRGRHADLDEHIAALSADTWTDLLAEDELKLAVTNAITDLPEREQTILKMSILDGVTSARIGESLGISANAVRKAKMRALAALRRRLESLGG